LGGRVGKVGISQFEPWGAGYESLVRMREREYGQGRRAKREGKDILGVAGRKKRQKGLPSELKRKTIEK